MPTPLQQASHAAAPAGDWAEEFYAQGWRGPHGRYPWVVLERVACSARRFEQVLREAEAQGGGWVFGLCFYRVLDAPTFDVYADTPTRLRIVSAIREAPARRAAEFEQFERPNWEARGVPPALLVQMTPRPDQPLTVEGFQWPILLVATEPDTCKLVLLGTVASMDIVLHALVARHDAEIDEAVALLILLTCHGKPADVKYDILADGTKVPRLTFADSAYTQPFHPKRFTEIRLALRSTTDSVAARRAALLQLLAKHIPEVIASLRRSPPSPGMPIHSVARSRLAEVASDGLLGRSRRAKRHAEREPWWKQLDALTLRVRRLYLRSLSRSEREEVQAARKGKRSARNPSTKRVLLLRAKAKLRNVMRPGSD